MLYQFLKPIVAVIVRLVWHPGIRGTENLPTTGGAVLASNHVSWAETVFMPAQLPRVVHFLAKSTLMNGKRPSQRLIGALLRGIHLVPVDREGGSATGSVVEAGLAVLRRGDVLGVYPEGTRSPDGRLYRGKTGAARMALEAGVPIIPVAVHGAAEAFRGGRAIPRRRPRIIIELGAAMDPREIAEASDPRVAAREVTDALMARLQEMTGVEYVPEYASAVKKRLRGASE